MTSFPAQPSTTAPGDRTLVVRCHQLAPVLGRLEHNLSVIDAAIRAAVASGIQLLVLPELATSGYYFADTAEAHAASLPADAAVFTHWAGLLGNGMVLVVGFSESTADAAVLYNSVAVIEPSGVSGLYRKTHLWDDEKSLFQIGMSAPPVIETAIGRLGVLICYDLEFPELPRSLALRGADVIAVPTNWPLVPRPAGERPAEVVNAMAAARSSSIPIFACDRAGVERGNAWTEGTTIVGSDGWPLATPNADGIADATVPMRADRTRIGARNDVFADRRPELYG